MVRVGDKQKKKKTFNRYPKRVVSYQENQRINKLSRETIVNWKRDTIVDVNKGGPNNERKTKRRS